jgi:hypothetical protein
MKIVLLVIYGIPAIVPIIQQYHRTVLLEL